MFADSGCPMPDGVWHVLQGRTASPLPFNTIFSGPAWIAGGAAPPPPPPAGGAGAFGSGVMNAQPGPGASAAIAALGSKAPATSHANFFIEPSRSGARTRASATVVNIIDNGAKQQVRVARNVASSAPDHRLSSRAKNQPDQGKNG